MTNCVFLHIAYWVIAIIIISFYTVFAPEMFFYKVSKKEDPKLFDRWRERNLAWNIHQSLIHMVGSLTGFFSLDVLFFQWDLSSPGKFGIAHLVLLLLGIAGVMGFIPKLLFESKLENIGKK